MWQGRAFDQQHWKSTQSTSQPNFQFGTPYFADFFVSDVKTRSKQNCSYSNKRTSRNSSCSYDNTTNNNKPTMFPRSSRFGISSVDTVPGPGEYEVLHEGKLKRSKSGKQFGTSKRFDKTYDVLKDMSAIKNRRATTTNLGTPEVGLCALQNIWRSQTGTPPCTRCLIVSILVYRYVFV